MTNIVARDRLSNINNIHDNSKITVERWRRLDQFALLITAEQLLVLAHCPYIMTLAINTREG
jgi:hypothetical protein